MRLDRARLRWATGALIAALACSGAVGCRDRDVEQPRGSFTRPAAASSLQAETAQALESSSGATLAYDTVRFSAEDARDMAWLADDVTPLAYSAGVWWVAIATSHSGGDAEESPCRYRRPWDGGTSDGDLVLESWRRIAADSIERVGETGFAVNTLTASECTPQADIDREFAAVAGSLRGWLSPEAVWRLARVDSFRPPDGASPMLRYRVLRDSTLELPDEADLVRGERTLVCFAGDVLRGERCTMIDTPGHGLSVRGPESAGYTVVNRVTPISAIVYRDTIWVFGLRSHGQRVEPAWVGQPISVVPVFLGRVPMLRR